jgi:hypothetical protein
VTLTKEFEMHSLAVAKESHRAPRSVSGRSEPARIRGAIAEGRDGESIDRLAELSGEEAPEGAVLFAERDGVISVRGM